MLRLDRVLGRGDSSASLTLRYAERCKSRLRVELDDGTDAGLFLPRGTVLPAGGRLASEDGTVVVEIRAADEALYEVRAAHGAVDPHFDLLRGTYHLGNRHVPVQLSPGRLLLERDTVLRDLLLRLGLRVTEIVAPFEPEAGAYGGGHRHDHDDTGGMLGETLSREAHAAAAPDFSSLSFQPLGR